MTLFKKTYLYTSLFLLLLFLLLFLFSNINAANIIQKETAKQVTKDIKKFESVLQNGSLVDTAAAAIFKNEMIATVTISDFLEKKVLQIKNDTVHNNSFAALLFGSSLEKIKVHSKDSTNENITIVVTINEGYTNTLIEQYFNTALLVFLLFTVIALAALFFIIRSLLSPLEGIKNQVFHLKENKFMENRTFPKSEDLRELVVMLNETASNLKAKFKKDTEILNKYYEVIYHDEETGLNNRNYFTMHLNSEVDGGKEDDRGLVIFVKITNFDALNRLNGFKQLNWALQSLTKALEKLEMPYAVLARIKPDTFAYIVSNQKFQESKKIIARHYERLHESINKQIEGEKAVLAISAGEFHKGDSVKSLLSRVDTALNEAAMQSKGKKIAYAKLGQKALSKEERIRLIEYAFANDAFNIELRPVQDLQNDRKNFLKLIVFLKDEKENVYNKSQFLSILHEKGKIAAYDQNIINKVCTRYRLINQKITVMINISSEFINSLEHIRWLADKLEEISTNKNIKLCFSIKDEIVQNELEQVLQFAKLVYRFEHDLAVGQFTLDKEKLSYLKRLRPKYIVVDQEYIQQLYRQDKSRVKAINFMVHEVEAHLVVSYMEDPQRVLDIEELEVDYLLTINYKGEY